MNKRQNGVLAEITAAQHYAGQGYEIFWPLSGAGSCDFITLKDGKTDRVQVKKAYWMERKSVAKYLQATTRKGCGAGGYQTYTKADCDTVVITTDNDIFIIPVEELDGLQSVLIAKGQETRRGDPRSFDAQKFRFRQEHS